MSKFENCRLSGKKTKEESKLPGMYYGSPNNDKKRPSFLLFFSWWASLPVSCFNSKNPKRFVAKMQSVGCP